MSRNLLVNLNFGRPYFFTECEWLGAMFCKIYLMCLTRFISYKTDIMIRIADFILRLVLYGQKLGL